MKYQLIYPMAFYVAYIFCLLIVMFQSRVKALKTGKVNLKFFRSYTGDGLPEEVIVAGRHYDNQFQVPQLFFMTCVSFMALGVVTPGAVALAWLFVFTRLVHTVMHLGKNRVQKRMLAFAAGWLVILTMWIHLVYICVEQGM